MGERTKAKDYGREDKGQKNNAISGEVLPEILSFFARHAPGKHPVRIH